ncbi:Crp/Fnr family transcriptional regulator [Jatrophihabitans sp.]|uniref:Crp/Fnr family transcriptional regulator n=1 Tax=Jatrophihabitans sp. TaxID=1932789 RepID=UPI002F0C2871
MTSLIEPAAASGNLLRLMSDIPGSTVVTLDRKQIVYGCLDRASGVYLVERGHVKVVAPSREGRECLLGIYSTGDLVGELCLNGETRGETVTTMTKAVLRRFSRARLMSALDDASVREEFVRYLVHRLVEQQQMITHFVTADSEYRLAAVLLHVTRKMGRRSGPLLILDARITQEELSGMVGTTRSRVGLFLKHFIDSGMVLRSQDGVLAVHEQRLEAFMAMS